MQPEVPSGALCSEDFELACRRLERTAVARRTHGEPAMIKNGRQYRITGSHVEKFERALQEIASRPSQAAEVDPLVQRAIAEGMESQLSELREEMAEYEALRS